MPTVQGLAVSEALDKYCWKKVTERASVPGTKSTGEQSTAGLSYLLLILGIQISFQKENNNTGQI